MTQIRSFLISPPRRPGITEEQKAEGNVLPICLDEVRRCSYFIGILGNRYGAVPDTIPQNLIENESWTADDRGCSVTELEMVHGAINDPSKAGHAFFYFRSPSYPDGLEPETPANTYKLTQLKNRIRAAGFRPHENYPDPKAFGELVEADLRTVIENRFPKTELDHLDQEWVDHESYAEHRRRVYVSRSEYFAALDAHAAGDGAPLVVVGDSGLGKSSLLANWAANYSEGHPDQLILSHFIGATRTSAEWTALVRRLLGELARRFDIALEIPPRVDLLHTAFASALRLVAVKHRVVILLDSLDQLEDRDGAPDLVWLPTIIPSNVRLVVSTLPGRPLVALEKRGWPILRVEPLTLAERMRLIPDYLRQFSRALEERRIDKIASVPQSCSPLYLGALLEEMRLFGVYELLDEGIAYYLQAENASDLYTRILARWERDYEQDRPGWVREALTMLWAARRGLSESELLEALGTEGEPLPHALWSTLNLAASHALLNRSGLVGPAHGHLRRAVETLWLATEEERLAAHQKVAEYFSSRQSETDRALDEMPWQLMHAEEWEKLRDFLVSPELMEKMWEKDAHMVRRYWHEIEAHSSLRLVDSYSELLEEPPTAGRFSAQHVAANLLREFGFAERSLTWCRKARSLTVSLNRFYWNATTKLETSILQDRGDFKAVVPLLGDLISACASDDKPLLVMCLIGRGAALNSLGQYEAGLTDLKKAEELAKDIGDARLAAKVALERGLGSLHLGAFVAAEQQLREAERASRESGDNVTLAATLDALGSIFMLRGDLDAALRLFEDEATTCRECSDQIGLARAITAKGNLLGRMNGDHASLLRLFDDAEELCKQSFNPIGQACAIGCRARFLRRLGRFTEALDFQVTEAAIWRKMDALLSLASCLLEQCATHHAMGAADGAKRCFEEASAILDRLGTQRFHSMESLVEAHLGEQPAIPEAQTIPIAYSNPAEVQQEEQRLLQAIRDDGIKHGEASTFVWKLRMELGNLLQLTGRPLEAEAQLSQALVIAQALFGARQNTSTNLNLLAVARMDLGDSQGAEKLLKEALDIDSQPQVKWSEARAQTLENLGTLMMRQGRLAEAEKHYRGALEILELMLPVDHESLSIPLSGLGCVLDDLGKKVESEQLHRRALAIDLRVFGPDHPRLAIRQHNLGCLLRSMDRLLEARECFMETLDIDRKVQGVRSRTVVQDLLSLAELSTEMADYDDAAARILEVTEALQGAEKSEKDSCFKAFTLSGPVARELPRADAISLLKRTMACVQKAHEGDTSETGQMLRGMALASDAPTAVADLGQSSSNTRAESRDNVSVMLTELTRSLAEQPSTQEGENVLRRALPLLKRSKGSERLAVAELLHRVVLCQRLRSWKSDEAPRSIAGLTLDELVKGVGPDMVARDRDLQHAASSAWFQVSERAIGRGDWDFAIGAAGISLELLRRLAEAEDANPTWSCDCARTLTLKGELELERGESGKARLAFEQAKAEYRRLVQLQPEEALFLRGLAVVFDKLGDIARTNEDFEPARDSYEQALPAFRRASRLDPVFLRDVSLCLAKLGELAVAEEDLVAAKLAIEEHFVLATKIAMSDPDHTEHQRDLAGAHGRMAQLAAATENITDAITHTREAHEILEAVALADPSNVRWQQDLAASFFNLGMLLAQTGDAGRGGKLMSRSYRMLSEMDRADQLDAKGRRLLQHLRSVASKSR